MSLQQQLEAIREDLESRIPKPALEIMHKATDDLVASGIQDGITGVGQAFPSFALNDQDGQQVTLADCLAKGPLVLTFYRGLWCPYCNADLAYFGSVADEVTGKGATMLAISPQTATYSKQVRAKNALSFPILTDVGNEVAAQLGLRFRLPDPLLQLYRDSFGISLPTFHGEDSWTLPMPARYVIDTSGDIRYAEASADYTKRPDPDAMLAALSEL